MAGIISHGKQKRYMNMTPLVVMTLVVCTSIWVAIDSKANRITSDDKPYSFMNGAFVWFSFCILFWIITFPYYLVRRSKLLSERNQEAMPPPMPTVAAVPVADIEQELRSLARLKKEGIITEEEFDQKMKNVLGLIEISLQTQARGLAVQSTNARGSKPKNSVDPVRAIVTSCGVVVVLAVVGILLLVVATTGHDGVKPTPSATANDPSDPLIRYIGDNGAVAGYDNYAGTARLAPGTQVRLTGGTWMGSPAGPQKIYAITQGKLSGMQVPLGESDLRPR